MIYKYYHRWYPNTTITKILRGYLKDYNNHIIECLTSVQGPSPINYKLFEVKHLFNHFLNYTMNNNYSCFSRILHQHAQNGMGWGIDLEDMNNTRQL